MAQALGQRLRLLGYPGGFIEAAEKTEGVLGAVQRVGQNPEVAGGAQELGRPQAGVDRFPRLQVPQVHVCPR